MGFSEEHAKWLEYHLSSRTGERRNRLERGHGHGERIFAERIWWLLMGNLDGLHPEYEVLDWRGRPYFIDFAWIAGQLKFAIEVKGFGPHVQNSDRIRYRRELDRELYLNILGNRVISIPYDDLVESPELTLSLLKSLFSPYMVSKEKESEYSRLERETLLVAIRKNEPVRPADLVNELGINRRTAVGCLKALCDKGKFRPIASKTGRRVARYEFIHSFSDNWIW